MCGHGPATADRCATASPIIAQKQRQETRPSTTKTLLGFTITHSSIIMSVSKSRAQSAEQMKSTFGQQGNVVLPSTLNYKERTELKRQSAFEYGR